MIRKFWKTMHNHPICDKCHTQSEQVLALSWKWAHSLFTKVCGEDEQNPQGALPKKISLLWENFINLGVFRVFINASTKPQKGSTRFLCDHIIALEKNILPQIWKYLAYLFFLVDTKTQKRVKVKKTAMDWPGLLYLKSNNEMLDCFFQNSF